jgi:anti-sigma factor RsiW
MPNDDDNMLSAYADGELDTTGIRAVEERLATDPADAEQVEAHRQMTALLRAACHESGYTAGAAALLQRASTHRIAPRRIAWAIAASIAFALIGFGAGAWWGLAPPSDYESLLDEVAEYHGLYSRETTHLAEVPPDHIAELTSWLGLRLERRLTVPDLRAAGLQFAGGRMLVIDGRPVAQFMYTRSQGLPVGLCIAKLDERHTRPLRIGLEDGLREASWQDGAYAYVIVGELDRATARELADRAAEQLRI